MAGILEIYQNYVFWGKNLNEGLFVIVKGERSYTQNKMSGSIYGEHSFNN